MRKSFLALIAIAGLTLAACNRSENTSSEAVEEVTTEMTQNAQNFTAEVTKNEAKVISKVQVIRSDEEFYEKVCEISPDKGMRFKGELPVLVDFYADWCGPCQQVGPYLVEFAKKYAGQIIIYKVNIDKNPNLASAFKIQSIPNLIFFKAGKQPTQAVGALPKAELEKAIQELLLN